MNRFIILSYPRCGTHMLNTALKSNKFINIRGEYYARVKKYLNSTYNIPEASLEEVYNNAFVPLNKQMLAAGFIMHRIHHDDVMFSEYLKNDNNLKIIYLHRENLLRRYISEEISIQTNIWRRSIGEKNTDDITVVQFNGPKFLRNLKIYHEKNAFYLNRFRNNEMYYTTYENLVSNFNTELTNIQEFLNVPVCDVFTNTEKTTVRTLKEIVTNYDEMCTFLNDNKLDCYDTN